jgi:hypothetical protein
MLAIQVLKINIVRDRDQKLVFMNHVNQSEKVNYLFFLWGDNHVD